MDAIIDKITAGNYHTCMKYDDGIKVKCYGDNEFGQLGLGDGNNRGGVVGDMGNKLPYVDILGSEKDVVRIVDINAGALRTCALLSNKKIKCYGYNLYGSLGLGDKNKYGDNANEMGDHLPYVTFGEKRLVNQFTCGYYHTCGLIMNQNDNNSTNIICYGFNGSGQLGIGNDANVGDQLAHMGDNLVAVDLGIDNKSKLEIYSVHSSALSHHTCVLFSNMKSLKCWGNNSFGQLGLGDTNNRGDQPNEMGVKLPFVDIGKGKKIQQISLGDDHTCLLLSNDATVCWGQNSYGQLVIGSTKNVGTKPNEMGNALIPVKWGKKLKATSLVVGWGVTCAVFDKNKGVKCFGLNSNGQLGQGDIKNRGDTSKTLGDKVKLIDFGYDVEVKQVKFGYAHGCVLFVDGKVKCWGDNRSGYLGYENKTSYGNEPNQMGSNLPFVKL